MAADFQGARMNGLQKLVEVCERGLGVSARVWFQRQYKRTVHADIPRIRDRDERDMEMSRVTPLVQTENSFPTLHERVARRVLFQEMKRQRNLEDILDRAWQALSSETPVSPLPVDEDWAARFFAVAQDVSHEPMRKFCGRLLAREVRQPGSFSLRCLESVRSLTRFEAEALDKIAPFVVNGEAVLRNPDVGELLQMREFHALVDAGVINGSVLQWEIPAPDARVRLADLLVQLSGEQTMVLDAWRLTGIGMELIPLVTAKANRSFVRWLLEEADARDFRCSVHRMLSRDPVTWDPVPAKLHEI